MVKNSHLRRLFHLLPAIALLSIPLVSRRLAPSPALEPVTLAVAQQPAFALIYVADRQGFFEAQGLEVSFRRHLLGRDALKDAVEGRADLATVFDIPTLNEINKGTDLAILTTLHSADSNHAIAAFKNRGIATSADLRGKKVAMTQGVSTEFFLNSFLITQGIDPARVQAVSLEPPDLLPSLENHLVDAAVLFHPYLYKFQAAHPPGELTILYSDAYKEMSVLTGTREFVDQNPDRVTRVLRALYQAEQYIQARPQDAVRIVDDWLEDYDSQGVVATWDLFDYSLTLNNKLLLMMERESRFFTATGRYTTATPYLRKFFLTDYLKTVKPEGVTIY